MNNQQQLVKSYVWPMALTILLGGCSAYQINASSKSSPPFNESMGHIPAETVREAVTKAHKLFTYDSDVNGEWTSYGAELALGVPFNGDCEDFAITVADYLTALGHDRRHLALALVNVGWIPRKGSYNHAVLIVSTEEGQMIVDNNRRRATRGNFYDSGVWHSLRRMDSDQWHEAETVEK